MARKRTYFRYDSNTDTMETMQTSRRRVARDGGWSTDKTTARRRAASRVSPLDAELARLNAMGRDDLRREAVARDLPGRRNKSKTWLLDALCADAHSRLGAPQAIAA